MGKTRLAFALVSILAASALDAWALPPVGAGTGNGGHEPPATRTTKNGFVRPGLLVVSILYTPPGAGSQVKYSVGSTTGSQTTNRSAYRDGVAVEVRAGIATDSGYTVGRASQSSFEVKKTTAETIMSTSAVDPLDHGTDVFLLWANPELAITEVTTKTADAPPAIAVQQNLRPPSGSSVVIVRLLARQLADPSTIPPEIRKQFPNAKDSDFTAALRLDPFYSTHGTKLEKFGVTLDPKRFTKTDSLQLDGPDAPNDPVVGEGLDVTQEATQSNLTGASATVATALGVTSSTTIFNGFTVETTSKGTMDWTYEESTEISTGSAQVASVMLQTKTVGYHARYDVYFDHLFKTFAFAPAGGSSELVLTGIATRGGAAAAGEIVTFTFPSGERRRVRANAKGEYRLYGAPPGAVKQTIGTDVRNVTLDARTPQKLTVNLPSKTVGAPPVAPR